MRFPALFCAFACLFQLSAAPSQRYLTDPSLCPTRPELAFVAGGDIWVAPASGGEARLLVAHPAEDLRPLYSPDGSKLAFQSTRTGGGDIYILTIATGHLRRLTFDDGAESLDGWSRDGKWIYFSSGSQDVNRKNDLFRVKAEGGTPMAFSADRFTNEFQAAPSPDGSSVAFAARGNGDQQWWRNGHSHLDESEIWLWKAGGSYAQLADRKGRNMWPMWNPDGKTLYFMSDRGGAQNLWSLTVPAGTSSIRQLTKFAKGRVLFPSISYDGRTIVFEHDFTIWKYDVRSGEAAAIPLTLAGSGAAPAATRLPLTQFSDLSLSPDGRKIAVTGRGEVFAAGARDGGDAFRVTRTAGAEQQVAWAPDSSKIAYVAQRDDAVSHVFLYDFATRKEAQLTAGQKADAAPRFSPDGKTLSYLRDRSELHLMDVESKQDRVLVTGSLFAGFGSAAGAAWSHDGKWIAYVATGSQGLRNVFVIPSAAKDPAEAKQISFLPNANSNSVVWHPDGKSLYFVTGQRTESPQIAKIDLTPVAPTYREARFEDLFKPAEAPASRGTAASAKAAPKAVDIVFEGIRERLTFLPLGLDVFAPQISPDGRTLLFTTQVAGQTNLYTYPLDVTATGPRTARQLTSTAANKSNAQFTPDSREVLYLEGGRVQTMPLDTRTARAVNVNAETDVDFDKEKLAVFEQAWAGQRDGFYDPKMHGVDWTAVHATYKPLVEAATSRDELYRLLRLMVGELNASHSGITAPANPGGARGIVAQLGVRYDREAAETAGKLQIAEVLPHSPAALAKLQVGEEITAVDGVPVSAAASIDEQLQYKAGRRVTLSVGGTVAGREVTVQPVASVGDLFYRKWVEDNRAYVHKISNGKLGYVHIRDMSDTALKQLYLDLDAENRAKSGVVIDIRNNNGGFVNAYALDVFTRRGYMTMTTRGSPPAPARTSLGQRSLELPTILVVNQHSLSDAEDFTEGYRTLKLGKVVGEPTSGWIIYTGAMELVDGSSMRMPSTLVTGADGKNMELNPRPVDIPVTRPIGETYTGKDSQLDVAVKELLGGLK